MLAAKISADWDPDEEYEPLPKDVEGKRTYLGGHVWRNPELMMAERPTPRIGPDEVLIEVKACGICGSDVHMCESTPAGYIKYPGLTAFPCTPGHEFSGTVAKAGEKALSQKGMKFEEGDPICSEEMIWCGTCKPCRDGFPNHCTNLDELGFTVDGAMAEYVKVPSRTCWSIEELIDRYRKKGFEAGALVEPTAVAYNGMFERAGGFRPGSYITIFGAGPVGLASISLAKAAGAARVVVAEVSEERLRLAKEVGADGLINPREVESVEEEIFELTDGEGADMYIEAAGAFDSTWPSIEKTMQESEKINAKIVAIGRAGGHVPLWFEPLQVMRAQIYGSQGHSGHGIFPSVVRLMASGKIDMRGIITERFPLKKVPKAMDLASKEKDKQAKVMIKP